jgi:DNA-binding response OmpR family regulator
MASSKFDTLKFYTPNEQYTITIFSMPEDAYSVALENKYEVVIVDC